MKQNKFLKNVFYYQNAIIQFTYSDGYSYLVADCTLNPYISFPTDLSLPPSTLLLQPIYRPTIIQYILRAIKWSLDTLHTSLLTWSMGLRHYFASIIPRKLGILFPHVASTKSQNLVCNFLKILLANNTLSSITFHIRGMGMLTYNFRAQLQPWSYYRFRCKNV